MHSENCTFSVFNIQSMPTEYLNQSLHLHYPGWGLQQKQIPVSVNKGLADEPNPDLFSSKATCDTLKYRYHEKSEQRDMTEALVDKNKGVIDKDHIKNNSLHSLFKEAINPVLETFCPWEYNPNLVQNDKLLGEGSFGKIFPYQELVVKCSKDFTIKQLKNSMPEAILGIIIRHPNILSCENFYIDQKQILQKEDLNYNSHYEVFQMKMLMKKMDKSLSYALKHQAEIFSKRQIIQWFYRLVCGLEFLHNNRIVHRDIKPDNILLEEGGGIKLADLGGAKFIPAEAALQHCEDYFGTLLYSSPEIMKKTPPLKKDLFSADVWSLGITIIDMCLPDAKKINPYYKIDQKEKIVQENIKKVQAKFGGFWRNFGKKLASILQDLLNVNPNYRKPIQVIRKTLETKFKRELKLDEKALSIAESESEIDPKVLKGLNNIFQLGVEDFFKTIFEVFRRKFKNIPNFQPQQIQENNRTNTDETKIVELENVRPQEVSLATTFLFEKDALFFIEKIIAPMAESAKLYSKKLRENCIRDVLTKNTENNLKPNLNSYMSWRDKESDDLKSTQEMEDFKIRIV